MRTSMKSGSSSPNININPAMSPFVRFDANRRGRKSGPANRFAPCRFAVPHPVLPFYTSRVGGVGARRSLPNSEVSWYIRDGLRRLDRDCCRPPTMAKVVNNGGHGEEQVPVQASWTPSPPGDKSQQNVRVFRR